MSVAGVCHRRHHEVLLTKYVEVTLACFTSIEKLLWRTINMDRHIGVMTIGLTEFSSLDVYTARAFKETS